MSPIPLGIFAAAGAGGGASPAYEFIQTVYADSSAAVLTFSSIPQTYKHLQIRGLMQSFTNCTLEIGLNSISSNASHYLQGVASSVSSGASTGTSRMAYMGRVTYPYVAQEFSPIIIDILDYASSSKNKTVRAFSGQTNGPDGAYVMLASGVALSTAATTSVSLATNPGFRFEYPGRFSLYGIKG